MAGWLKKFWPQTEIHFLGKKYTRPLIEACQFVDVFWDVESTVPQQLKGVQAAILVFPELKAAKLLKEIPLRISTANRLHNWLYINKLISFSRRKSSLHEAQLNFKLFQPFEKYGIPSQLDLSQVPELYGLIPAEQNFNFLDVKKRIVLHTKSLGSAKDWPLENYLHLAQLLKGHQVYVSGTQKEGEAIRSELPEIFNYAQDITGKLTLSEFISFLSQVDVLVACSTGPLHIAAALGVGAVGLFSSVPPIHPGRWRPLGKKAVVLEPDFCPHRTPKQCHCIKSIKSERVFQEVMKLLSQ